MLAGGQSLMPMLNFRLATRRRWSTSTASRGLELRRGRGDTAWSPRRDGPPARRSGALAGWSRSGAAARRGVALIGHPAIRNRGTVGGSLAHADPAAELPARADSRWTARSTRRPERTAHDRARPISSWRTCTTALAADELLTEVAAASVPGRAPARRSWRSRGGTATSRSRARGARRAGGRRRRVAGARIGLIGVGTRRRCARATAERVLPGEAPPTTALDEPARSRAGAVEPPERPPRARRVPRRLAGGDWSRARPLRRAVRSARG